MLLHELGAVSAENVEKLPEARRREFQKTAFTAPNPELVSVVFCLVHAPFGKYAHDLGIKRRHVVFFADDHMVNRVDLKFI